MPFTTLAFIGFFAALFFAYYAIPRRFQWWLLLAGSMFFYGYASPFYLLLLWTTILVTYAGTLAIGKTYTKRNAYLKVHKQELSRDEKKTYKAGVAGKARCWLTCTLIVLLAMLGVFKYAQFVIDNFFVLLGWFGVNADHPQPLAINIILPVGLSFYLFQSIGYCIDVYREEVPPECNLFKHALFVSFFPQLMQGPIGNYGRLAPQLLSEHPFDYIQVKFGIQRVAWGFFKKLVIANRIAHYVNPVWSNVGDYSGFVTWFFFCFMYAIQLYADFSGYMDIACGCSQMLGVKIDENFNCPYFAKTIPEFWRRWHMTLSEWFKNYLFYPVLRSDWNSEVRKSFANKYFANVLPTTIALAIVWFTTGLWHGASWGYVSWGVYYGFFMILAVVMASAYDRLHGLAPRFFAGKCYSVFQMLRTFIIVVIGYSIFKPADLGVTAKIWASATALDLDAFVKVWHSHAMGWMMCFAGIAVLTFVDVVHLRGIGIRESVRRMPCVVRFGCYLAALWFIVFFGMYGAGLDQFEYFRF